MAGPLINRLTDRLLGTPLRRDSIRGELVLGSRVEEAARRGATPAPETRASPHRQ